MYEHVICRNETLCEYMAQSYYIHSLRRQCTNMVGGRGKYRNLKMTLQWAPTDASRVRNSDFFKLKMFFSFTLTKKHGCYQEIKRNTTVLSHIIFYIQTRDR